MHQIRFCLVIDFRYCVLLALAIHLEVFLGSEGGQGGLSPYVFGFSDDITVPDSDSKTEDKIQAILHDEMLCHEEFHDGFGGLLGSHSNRKLASTHAMKKNGFPREEKDLGGQWKRREHVSDVAYDDVDLLPRGEGSSRTVEETQACFGRSI
jgi:hypothetical protein